MTADEMTIQALREALRNRVSQITDEYEWQIAQLRVQLTQVTEKLSQLEAATSELKQEEPVVWEDPQHIGEELGT